MTVSAHILRPPGEGALARLRTELAPNVRLTLGPDLTLPVDFHILVAGRPKPEHLVASPNLRVLLIPWAGLPAERREIMQAFPHISVHNLHYNADLHESRC